MSTMLLLPVVLISLLASAAGSIGRPILFPGPTACTAPSGRAGDCVFAADCPASHGRPSQRACGIFGRGRWRLKFCCEREPLQGAAPSTTRPPFLTFPTQRMALPTPSAEAAAALPDDCGLGGPANLDGRAVPNISGGRDADRSSWPWAALLGEEQSDGTMRWLCGGALLGPRHVLTAAHCVVTMDRSKLVVRLGEHDVRAPSDTRQERRVRRVLAHPDFQRSLADLALLVLDEPVPLSRGGVHPVCLPPADARPLGRSGWVVGWGQLGFERELSDVLQEALVTVQETQACEAVYRRTREYEGRFPGGWRGSVLCAADETGGGKDACPGDSGGPLSIKRAPDGRYQLIGLVLEGMGCGNPDFPGLYTSVPHYVDWIRREVQNS